VPSHRAIASHGIVAYASFASRGAVGAIGSILFASLVFGPQQVTPCSDAHARTPAKPEQFCRPVQYQGLAYSTKTLISQINCNPVALPPFL
jgi:hypothetical protein